MESRLEVKMTSPDPATDVAVKEEPEDDWDLSRFLSFFSSFLLCIFMFSFQQGSDGLLLLFLLNC